MATSLFSALPLLNRLLEIVQEEVAKNGHIIQSFKRMKDGETVFYYAECSICRCTARVVCSAHEYSKRGTIFGQKCKPG